MQKWPSAVSSENFAAALLRPTAPLPSDIKDHDTKRFAVYRNNVVVGLVRALEANFPAVRQLLGAIYFAGLAREFVALHPPQSPLMFNYGTAFPEFLPTQTDLANFPYLTDVAQLEILLRQSYHAADAPVLDALSLAAVAPEKLGELRMLRHPALRLLASAYAVVSITHANRNEVIGSQVDPAVAEWALIVRPYFDAECFSVTTAQYAFIDCLASGRTLAEAADTALGVDDDFDLPGALSLILARGAFTSLTFEEAKP
jgi:Putative DNA-binding domain